MRCKSTVDYTVFRCKCTESPSPWALMPDINQAPKMSNRKLRHELEELKKQVEELRKELAARPTTTIIREYVPAPVTQPLPLYPQYPYYPDTIITCSGVSTQRVAPPVPYFPGAL